MEIRRLEKGDKPGEGMATRHRAGGADQLVSSIGDDILF